MKLIEEAANEIASNRTHLYKRANKNDALSSCVMCEFLSLVKQGTSEVGYRRPVSTLGQRQAACQTAPECDVAVLDMHATI